MNLELGERKEAPEVARQESADPSYGDDLNHWAPRRDIELSILTGSITVALCGARWTPEIRVGSSGGADDPDLPICELCETFLSIGRVDESSAR